MLEAPPTIRIPRPDEIPKNSGGLEKLKELENANIVEGFTFRYNEPEDPSFMFFAEININNSKLWNLFLALIKDMPDTVYFIYNRVDEEPFQHDFCDKKLIIDKIEDYKIELTQDCLIEFGLACFGSNKLEEVFVVNTKYIKYWGCDELAFRKTMSEYGLNHLQTLNFFDEFPNVIEPLTLFNKNARPTETVINNLFDLFTREKE